MHEVQEKIRHARWLLFGLFWVNDVVTPEWVGDIARSLLVLSAATNIWGGAQSIKGFATLRNVVNLHFFSEVKPEVVRDILRSAWVVSSEEERNIIFAPLDRGDETVAENGFNLFSNWASRKLLPCCRALNSRRATISYFGLIGNWLKREVEFWYSWKVIFAQIVFYRSREI